MHEEISSAVLSLSLIKIAFYVKILLRCLYSVSAALTSITILALEMCSIVILSNKFSDIQAVQTV